MADIFISLDVETSGPFPGFGELATIGAVAIDGGTLTEIGSFYERLLPAGNFNRLLHGRVYNQTQILNEWQWAADTRTFWEAQHPRVVAEAFEPGDDRYRPVVTAQHLTEWLRDMPGNPVFVAHPAGFDWAWVNHLLLEANLRDGMSVMDANPFGYRPMCLRAIAWALGDGEAWNVDRATLPGYRHDPDTPHNALSDAEAQGRTLVAVLREIRRRAAEPERA